LRKDAILLTKQEGFFPAPLASKRGRERPGHVSPATQSLKTQLGTERHVGRPRFHRRQRTPPIDAKRSPPRSRPRSCRHSGFGGARPPVAPTVPPPRIERLDVAARVGRLVLPRIDGIVGDARPLEDRVPRLDATREATGRGARAATQIDEEIGGGRAEKATGQENENSRLGQ